jgi:GntR family transcriptional regulator
MSDKVLPNYSMIPLNERIRNDLEYRIRASILKPGEKLPPEPEFAAMLGVSRNSLREAVKALQYSGLLIKRRGIGTFVTAQHPLINLGIEHLMSITQFIRRQGFESMSKVNKFQCGIFDDEASSRLGLNPTDRLMAIETVKYADSDPVALCLDFIPMELLEKLPQTEDLYESIFEGLERHYNINITFAECEILSVAADSQLAEKLKVAKGTTHLLLKQVHFDAQERRVLFSKSYFPSQKLTFKLIRRRLEAVDPERRK